MGAKVTITRNSWNEIDIEIKDDLSGLQIVSVKMTPHDFAVALTGLSYQSAEFTFTPKQFTVDNIGKTREVQAFFTVKVWGRDEQKKVVEDAFNRSGLANDGWMLFDDGTSSQQNGAGHRAVVYRFVEEK